MTGAAAAYGGGEHWRAPGAGPTLRKARHILRRLWRNVASLPADLAFAVINTPPMAAYLERRYTAWVRKHTPAGELSAAEAAVVAGLKQDGVFVTHLATLGIEESDILAGGGRVAATVASRTGPPGTWRPAVLAATPAELMAEPIVYRLGLHESILRIAEAYLGVPVGYDGPRMFNTIADGRESASRLWHLDREDRRLIKVGLYLHDVADDGGPFQLLKHETAPPDAPVHFQPLDTDTLRQKLGVPITPESIATCPGRAGTLVFAETARFYHRGKPATKHDRSMIYYSYFPRAPRHPFYCDRSRLSLRQIRELVAGLSPEQQAAGLWRRAVPWLTRWVPSSKL